MAKLPNDVAIRVSDVHKEFHLPRHNEDSIKRRVTQVFKKKDKTVDVHKALCGISFDIKKGEFFGIVGRNGSGKSTLLKIISEIYQPTTGSTKTQGKVVAFIELGVGFNPQLSGRENVFLNGAMLGFSRKEMLAMYDEIVAFSELEEFMDQKLKNYSSGMKVRLAFSVAIRAQADILILDEVLAVGDKAFQDKCYQYFEELKEAHKTIVLVSHSMNLIKQYCDKAIVIDDGKVVFEGNADDAADKYKELFTYKKTPTSEDIYGPRVSAKIMSATSLSSDGTLQAEITYSNISNDKVMAKAYIAMRGVSIMATNPRVLNMKDMITTDTREHTVIYSLDLRQFNRGEFKLIVLLEDIDTGQNIATYGTSGELMFEVVNPDTAVGGVLKNKAKMELIK